MKPILEFFFNLVTGKSYLEQLVLPYCDSNMWADGEKVVDNLGTKTSSNIRLVFTNVATITKAKNVVVLTIMI